MRDMHDRVPERRDSIAPLEIASPIGVLSVMPAAVHFDHEKLLRIGKIDTGNEFRSVHDYELAIRCGQPLPPDLLYGAGLKSTRGGQGTWRSLGKHGP